MQHSVPLVIIKVHVIKTLTLQMTKAMNRLHGI